MEKQRDIFRLGTRSSRIKKLYFRSKFRLCRQQLIDIEAVQNNERTIRSVEVTNGICIVHRFKGVHLKHSVKRKVCLLKI